MKLLSVSGLSKGYKNFSLDSLSLELDEGMILGLIGPNGAGKTTFLKILLGLSLPDSGEALVYGDSVFNRPRETKEKMGFVLEQDRLSEELSVKAFEALIKPFYPLWDSSAFYGYMERFSIDVKKKIGKLSKGMRMKVQLAAALCHKARLLLLDEPMHGLDPVSRGDLLDVLRQKVDEEGCGVIISSHITSDLDKCADYVAFLDEGRLLLYDPVDTLIEETALVKGPRELVDGAPAGLFKETLVSEFGFTALTRNRAEVQDTFGSKVVFQKPTLEDIMVHKMKGGNL